MIRRSLFAAFLMFTGGAAAADCNAPGLRAITPGGDAAWAAMAETMSGCGVAVSTGDPTLPGAHHLIGTDNNTLVAQNKSRALRPMNELIKAYPGTISEARLIRDDWRIVAIATTVEARHLMYRKDIFDKLKMSVPNSYGQILQVTYLIRKSGIMQTPYAGAYRTGDDMARSFIDVYLGMGGVLFLPGFDASIYNPRGVAAMEMMQMLSGYSQPDYLTTGAEDVEARLINGEIALAMLSSERAEAVKAKMGDRIAMAEAPIAGFRPASTLSWRGVGIAADATDAEAAAAFRVITEGLSPAMAARHAGAANWLIDGYDPAGPDRAAIATAEAGALPYPAGPQMELLREAIGQGVEPFLQGRVDPTEALLNIELAYKRAARAKGLLN